YHELAYLHPRRFTPNPRVLDEFGLSENTPFFIVRFVSWRAVHDMGEKGFTEKGKRQLVQDLLKCGRVILTSEDPLPPDLQTYKLSVSLEKVHDLLYYATMYVGEGATMASESAVLGTPSVYVSSITAGTLEEQEKKYDLLRHFRDEKDALGYVKEL